MPDERALPLASILLSDVGAGDPVTTDDGTWRYYRMEENRLFGSITTDANGMPLLEWISGIGLTCRAYYVPQDTRAANWSASGGAWEERRPATGAPRPYYLTQYSSAPDTEWSATSLYSLPEDASFALALTLYEPPADHDATTYPVYVEARWGGGEWAIRHEPAVGVYVVRRVGGVDYSWGDLPEPPGGSADGVRRWVFWVRAQRGRLLISADGGRAWTQFASLDGSALTVAAGTLALSGQGMAMSFGVHQLRYYAGVFLSQQLPTFVSRTPGLDVATFARSFYTARHGSGVALQDAATAGDAARFRATLTPSGYTGGPPWTVYHAPDAQAVLLRYESARNPVVSTYTAPWDGDLIEVDVDEPPELDGATASWVIERDAAVQFTGDYRDRKVAVLLSFLPEAGSPVWVTAFVGYIREPAPGHTGFNDADARFVADNITARAKGRSWNAVQGIPYLGGLTPNAALDVCLDYIGLDATYRSWDARGDAFTLPTGTAEEPFEWPREGEAIWETMQRLAAYAGCEIGGTRAGVFATVAAGWVSPVVTQTWAAEPGSAVYDAALSVRNRLDYARAHTRVVATAQGTDGGQLVAFVRDAGAETNAASGRFSHLRRVRHEAVPGGADMTILANACQALARELLLLKTEPDLEVPANPSVGRRDRVRVTGTKAGVGDAQDLAVLGMRHHWEFDLEAVRSTAGVRLVVE